MPTAAELTIIVEAQDRASAQLRALGGDVQRIERQVESACGAFGRLGGLMGSLGGIGLAAGGVGAIVSGVTGRHRGPGRPGGPGHRPQRAAQPDRADLRGGVPERAALRPGGGQSLGIARAEALQMAGNFGQLLRTSGLTEDAAADMSQQLLRLGADLASFNNWT